MTEFLEKLNAYLEQYEAEKTEIMAKDDEETIKSAVAVKEAELRAELEAFETELRAKSCADKEKALHENACYITAIKNIIESEEAQASEQEPAQTTL